MYITDLPSFLQSILCLAVFLLFVMSMYQMHLVYQMRVRIRYILLALLLLLVTGISYIVMSVQYTLHNGGGIGNYTASDFGPYFTLNWILLVMFEVLMVQLIGQVYIVRWKRTHTTSFSLKEGLDNLPDGLAFYEKTGIVLMMNRVMQAVAEEFTGHSIQNGKVFWESICNKELPKGYTCMESPGQEDSYLVISPRERIRRITRIQLPPMDKSKEVIYQIISEDVTESWRLTEALRAENGKLRIMNERLEDYRINLDNIVKEDELLAMRIRVHDDLGQMLLATRRYLTAPEEEKVALSSLIRDWKNLIQMLYNEDGIRVESVPERELMMAAQSLGLSLEVEGEFPEKARLLHLLMSGARECMTNAAHVNASKFMIEIQREGSWVVITYRNDGIPPMYPLREGGGLSSLRRLLSREGASLEIPTQGDFYVKMVIPDRRERR